MENRLFVGNLSYSVGDDTLQDQFSAFGSVVSARVMTDRDSGRSKGFGFVEMSSPAEAQAAIEGLNGKDVEGRALTVNIAQPKERREGGGGYREGGGGGGYRGGRRDY